MSGKAGASKKNSQELKRNPKRKKDSEEVVLSEKKFRNTMKRNKNHLKDLSSEVTGQTRHTNLKQVKTASSKRKTWQPLSKSSRDNLQTMMESVIITILIKSIKEKEEIQYHLNFLKKRLLQLCETLKVPPKKTEDLANVSSLLNVERARNKANAESLALLQEEIDKMVETAELMTGNIQRLENKIEILASEVEEEEEKVKQMHQINNSGVLSLPELSQKTLKAPTLQKEILALIPNQNALLKDLDILHNSSQMKSMLTFIEEAYKKLDAS
ncbi:centromere protein Q isoform X1 [Callithrix jacchus]|uniref:Centromere protein Q n=1 Tax=Callithrix jacchus TaxID=9483 RepID=F6S7B4_CALJA|nr:centromere protein Q isoform X1 [Callithrix jacchus]XP_035151757.2 centromere protein Q isoform X1 [Callithrix jacchus]